MIRIGLPKGRMASESESFCDALGIQVRPGVLRYRTVVGDLNVSILLLKAPDIALLLRRNLLELGVAGDEWLMEAGASPGHRCFETRSYMASVCLLTAEGDPRPLGRIHSVVTPYPNLARRLLSQTMPDAEIMAVSGSSEALVPDVADACLDVVETGTSAMLNCLAVRRCFVNVTTHLVRSEGCNPAMVAPVIGLLAHALEVAR